MSLLTLLAAPSGSAPPPPAGFVLDQLLTGGRTGAAFAFSDLDYLTTDGSTPVTAANDPIGQMANLCSGRTYPIAAAGTKRPQYRVDGNGRGYGWFDGIDDILVRADECIFGQATDATMVVALGRRGNTGVRVMAANRTPLYCHPQLYSSSATIYGYWNQVGAQAGPVSTFVVGDGYVFTLMRRGNVFTLRRNGIQVSTATVPMAAPDSPNSLHVGGYAGANATSMNLYAIAGISGDLSAGELAILEGWAADEIGITI